MKPLVFAALALAGAVSARITGLAAPAVIAPNDKIKVTLITSGYIQSVKDVSAAFGLSPVEGSSGFVAAQFLGSFYLGPDKSNTYKNITIEVTTPADLNGVKYLNGVVNSLYGASNGAVTYSYSVPVTPGRKTSRKQKSDIAGVNGHCFASPASSKRETCFPTSTQSSIQSSIQLADALTGSILTGNNRTGVQNRRELNGRLGDVFRAIDLHRGGESACNNPSPPAWPPLSPADSRSRATSILRDVQSGLQTLSGNVLACDETGTFRLTCQILRLVDNLERYYTF